MKLFELPKMEIAIFDEDVVTGASGGGMPTGSLTKGAGDAAGSGIISDVTAYSISYDAIDMGA
ncbi:MAG: hypothetical protein IJH37_07885 [Clostridia bacterium]|nr:hypothetical protein [Clostridia bacterium]